MIAHPFLKWAGGKTQLLPELMDKIPVVAPGTLRYHEPFLGGGALFFHLASSGMIARAYLSDSNPVLVDAYVGVRDHVDAVIANLFALSKNHCKAQYENVRSVVSQPEHRATVAARMIYLNKTCFNGLWRTNRKGINNVPMGKFKSPPTICDPENLRACSEALRNTSIRCIDFRKRFDPPLICSGLEALPGDLVYFDPPYVPLSKTSSFVGYTKEGFGPKDQEDLAELARKLKDRGVHVLVSNSGSDEALDVYHGFDVSEVAMRRNINSKGGKRGAVKEHLFY